jgi:hypothetical protein
MTPTVGSWRRTGLPEELNRMAVVPPAHGGSPVMASLTPVFGVGFLIVSVLFAVWIVRMSLRSDAHRPQALSGDAGNEDGSG